jgi:uncharacterized protein YndB with AHSA1/START domain
MSAKKARSYEKQFEVAAPVESVWKAITEGEELTRWFCQHATSEPKLGGEIQVDWGGGAKGTQTIAVWNPNVHLRTESKDRKLEGANPDEPYAVDWYLEHDGGITRVRMVASGFGEGPEWDYEYDGTFHGWDLFHKTLKHYLEHHRGEPAKNVVIYAIVATSTEEAWSRLMSPEGLMKKGQADDLRTDAPFSIETSQGDVLAGVVKKCVPGKTFSATVDSLNKAILTIELGKMPGQGNFVYLSLNTWGMPEADVDALGSRLKTIVYGLFPQKADAAKSGCAAESSE